MKLHCVRQLNKDSWEYRVKRSGDEPNCDDAVLLVDELDEREKIERVAAILTGGHPSMSLEEHAKAIVDALHEVRNAYIKERHALRIERENGESANRLAAAHIEESTRLAAALAAKQVAFAAEREGWRKLREILETRIDMRTAALAAERKAHENETAHREATHEKYVRASEQRDKAEAVVAAERALREQEHDANVGLEAALAAEREKCVELQARIRTLNDINGDVWKEKREVEAALARAEREIETHVTVVLRLNDKLIAAETALARADALLDAAFVTIDGLAAQQAMPDDSWKATYENIAAHLRDREGGAA